MAEVQTVATTGDGGRPCAVVSSMLRLLLIHVVVAAALAGEEGVVVVAADDDGDGEVVLEVLVEAAIDSLLVVDSL